VLCVGFGTGPMKDDMETCRQTCSDTVVVDQLDGRQPVYDFINW